MCLRGRHPDWEEPLGHSAVLLLTPWSQAQHRGQRAVGTVCQGNEGAWQLWGALRVALQGGRPGGAVAARPEGRWWLRGSPRLWECQGAWAPGRGHGAAGIWGGTSQLPWHKEAYFYLDCPAWCWHLLYGQC